MTPLKSLSPMPPASNSFSGLAGFAPLRAGSGGGSAAEPAGSTGLFAELMATLEQRDNAGQGVLLAQEADYVEPTGAGLAELAERLLLTLSSEDPAGPAPEALLDELKALAEAVSQGSTASHGGLSEQQQAWLSLIRDLQSAGYSRSAGPYSVAEGFVKAIELADNRLPGSLQGLTRGEVPREFVPAATSTVDTRGAAQVAPPPRAGSALELLNLLASQQGDTRDLSSRPGLSAVSGVELRSDSGGPSVLSGQAIRPMATEWAPVRVDTSHGQWARDLVSALGDRLSMQVNQQVREATVRLDPPEMGKIELIVRMDGDRLNVQLNASNVGVRDMLTQHAERLRADLLAQNLQTVDVHVGEEGQRRDSRQSPAFGSMIEANPEADEQPDDTSGAEADDRWLSTSA